MAEAGEGEGEGEGEGDEAGSTANERDADDASLASSQVLSHMGNDLDNISVDSSTQLLTQKRRNQAARSPTPRANPKRSEDSDSTPTAMSMYRRAADIVQQCFNVTEHVMLVRISHAMADTLRLLGRFADGLHCCK